MMFGFVAPWMQHKTLVKFKIVTKLLALPFSNLQIYEIKVLCPEFPFASIKFLNNWMHYICSKNADSCR